jgi:ribose 1,5-bisphosphokinase
MMVQEPHMAAGAEEGTMVVVVGPSGAGKDTLMALAARHFEGRSDVHFVRRVITRDGEAGGEDHLAVSEGGFEAMEKAGAFAVTWEAHGLRYGIPAEVFEPLHRGNLVIANGSRSVLHRFQATFPRLKVINVTARPEILASRLEARGRETHEDIMARLARGPLTVRGEYDVTEIDNSGSLEEAERKIVDALSGLLSTDRQPQ